MRQGGRTVPRPRWTVPAQIISAPPAPPTCVTGAPSNLTSVTATLNASVNPEGSDAQVYFEWGLTTAYGNVTPTQDAGSGSAAVAVAAAISGLAAGTVYHVQAVAVSATGSVYGGDVIFRSLNAAGPFLPSTAAAQRNPFTYPAWDLVAAEPIDTLPYTNVSFGAPLNQPGSWSGNLSLADTRIGNFNYVRGSAADFTTAGFVDFAGTLIWGGILTSSNYDSSDPTKTKKVTAAEFGAFFQSRVQAADYSATWAAGQDPMLIAQQVCEDALSAGTIFGGITLVLNSPYSPPENGIQITPSYPDTALQTIDSIVSILSQMGYFAGFDYTFDCAYLPGTSTPAITMNFWYPRKGRTAAQSQLVLLNKDCTFTWPVDATERADKVIETGSGIGSMTPESAQSTPFPPPGVPVLEKTFARSQINDQGTLAAVTAGDQFLSINPAVTPTFTIPIAMPDPVTGQVPPTAAMPFGSFDRGDDFIFRADPVAGGGENSDPYFPDGVRVELRIESWQANIADKGVSTLVLSTGIPPGQFPPPLIPV